MLHRLPCISLGVQRGCYIVVIKLSLGEGNLIIYNLVITFQSHAVQEINNVRVSLGIKKQMAPPPGLLPLTFESLPFGILWVVSYIKAQINDFGACEQWMSPLWHSVYLFMSVIKGILPFLIGYWLSHVWSGVQEEWGEKKPCCFSWWTLLHLAVKQSRLFHCVFSGLLIP